MSNKNLLIIAAICLVLGLATRVINNLPPANPYALSSSEQAKLGQPVPDFAVTTIDGRDISLEEFSDKSIVLNFWASWCAPCVAEFPQMLNLARETQDSTVYIFLSNDVNEAAIERFLATLRKTHPKELDQDNVFIAHDAKSRIAHTLFQTYRLPETYLIAPGGTLIDKVIGASVQWDAPEMVDKIRKLAEKAGDTATSAP